MTPPLSSNPGTINNRLPICIVGHVDHGKSTLIGQLLLQTGSFSARKLEEIRRVSLELGKDAELSFLTDQLEEERTGGITLDTTQVFFGYRGRDYVIIDTPGHAEFIRNMLSGATQAKAAVLIVDAAEGVMSQTRRHARLLELIGLRTVIIAINKMDLAGYSRERYEQVSSEARALFSAAVNIAAVLPLSARDAAGFVDFPESLKWFCGPALLDVLHDVCTAGAEERDLPLRLPIQDSYRHGGRRIAVGRIALGELRKAADFLLLPSRGRVRARSIRFFEGEREAAFLGENVGVEFEGDAAPGRGEVLCSPDRLPSVGSSLEGRIFWMSEFPLCTGDKILMRCSTQEGLCEIAAVEEIFDLASEIPLRQQGERLGLHEIARVRFLSDKPFTVDLTGGSDELRRFVVERDNRSAGVGIFTGAGDRFRDEAPC